MHIIAVKIDRCTTLWLVTDVHNCGEKRQMHKITIDSGQYEEIIGYFGDGQRFLLVDNKFYILLDFIVFVIFLALSLGK